jgi:hypothetical protein
MTVPNRQAPKVSKLSIYARTLIRNGREVAKLVYEGRELPNALRIRIEVGVTVAYMQELKDFQARCIPPFRRVPNKYHDEIVNNVVIRMRRKFAASLKACPVPGGVQ